MRKKPVGEKPRPKYLGKPKKIKNKKGYSAAKKKADKKFGKKTSLVKNMYISKQMKKS